MTTPQPEGSSRGPRRCLRVEIRGAVQGVGFRPFVYRLARELGLTGWVLNDSRGVFIEAEGTAPALESFRQRLADEKPPRAVLLSLEWEWREPQGHREFAIRRSRDGGSKSVVMLPDIATCGDCLAEVFDPDNRRFRYPFTNCTNCGPRFTIIRSLPYDRPSTTMRRFEMCPDCRREYEDPLDRRFHAQPNACPRCGPRLQLLDARGQVLEEGDPALVGAAAALCRGDILAAKGLGGFHLMVDARNGGAVDRLRRRKGRYEKPLALMVRDLTQARNLCRVDPDAETWLRSPEAPIVLLPRLAPAAVAVEVAPGNPRLGVMLPYTPLHHLLLAEVDIPLVATSGNLSDEPICIDNDGARERLGAIADLFLVHDRPVQRHADDSVIQLIEEVAQPIRRARGLAPMPLVLARSVPTVLAVGGHLKNVVALSLGEKVFLSQHIGDMETPQAFAAFEAVIRDFLAMYEAEPVAVAHDLHPDYPSTRWALDAVAREGSRATGQSSDDWTRLLGGRPTIAVQHHHAHLAACLAEHRLEGPALGVTWDGTGYGTDGTVWGGEFLLGDARRFRRVARLRPFSLPGGDAAIKAPCRVALALLWEIWGEETLERTDLPPIRALADSERGVLASMLAGGFRTPRTTSAGRLFDAVAAILGLRQQAAFEGQAAMALEFAADSREQDSYPVDLRRVADDPDMLELNWQPLVEAVIEDSRRGLEVGIIAARFHNALVEAIAAVARAIGESRVALTGGCFQNRRLNERAARRLRDSGLDVLTHRLVPANDGGLGLGQIAVAAARLEAGTVGTGERIEPCV